MSAKKAPNNRTRPLTLGAPLLISGLLAAEGIEC
jgi:hypothetical protein